MAKFWDIVFPHLLELSKDLLIPVILLIVGGVGKALARARHEDEDWFLGPDLILAGLATMLVAAVDAFGVFLRHRGLINGARPTDQQIDAAGMLMGSTIAYSIVACVLYFVLLRLGQILKVGGYDRRTRVVWLALVGNFIGLTSVAVTMFLIHES